MLRETACGPCGVWTHFGQEIQGSQSRCDDHYTMLPYFGLLSQACQARVQASPEPSGYSLPTLLSTSWSLERDLPVNYYSSKLLASFAVRLNYNIVEETIMITWFSSRKCWDGIDKSVDFFQALQACRNEDSTENERRKVLRLYSTIYKD